jgi:plastocyanin
MNETMFYVLGAGLASLAVITSFVGLRVPRFPGSSAAMVAIIATFVTLVGGTTTFAVLHAKDEEGHKAAELHQAGEEAEEIEQESAESGQAGAAGGQEATAKGSGETLKLAADPTQIAFDTTSLSSKPGEVTIDFSNPAAIEHNVAIEEDGRLLAESDTITQGETSVTVDLSAGTYSFVCTVPGHEEAGMKGTLTVK